MDRATRTDDTRSEMKALFLSSVALIFLLMAGGLWASDSITGESGPTHYTHPRNAKHWSYERGHVLTPEEMKKITEQVHGIDYLPASDATQNVITAPVEPRGSVKLDKIIPIDNR